MFSVAARGNNQRNGSYPIAGPRRVRAALSRIVRVERNGVSYASPHRCPHVEPVARQALLFFMGSRPRAKCRDGPGSDMCDITGSPGAGKDAGSRSEPHERTVGLPKRPITKQG